MHACTLWRRKRQLRRAGAERWGRACVRARPNPFPNPFPQPLFPIIFPTPFPNLFSQSSRWADPERGGGVCGGVRACRCTVYEKGAEVIRMYATLLGRDGFRRGMDLYFQRHDGQARGPPLRGPARIALQRLFAAPGRANCVLCLAAQLRGAARAAAGGDDGRLFRGDGGRERGRGRHRRPQVVVHAGARPGLAHCCCGLCCFVFRF